MEVPTLAAEGKVEAPVGSPSLDHEPCGNGPAQGLPQIAGTDLGKPLRQVGALAEPIVGDRDDCGDDLVWGRRVPLR